MAQKVLNKYNALTLAAPFRATKIAGNRVDRNWGGPTNLEHNATEINRYQGKGLSGTAAGLAYNYEVAPDAIADTGQPNDGMVNFLFNHDGTPAGGGPK